MRSLFKYIKDTRAEMKHVAWPTQQQTISYTALVVVVSLLTAAYLGVFDFLFTRTLESTLRVLPGQTSEQVLSGTTTPATSTSSVEVPAGVEFSATGVDAEGNPVEINAGGDDAQQENN